MVATANIHGTCACVQIIADQGSTVILAEAYQVLSMTTTTQKFPVRSFDFLLWSNL